MKTCQTFAIALGLLGMFLAAGCGGGGPVPDMAPDDPRADWPRWYFEDHAEEGLIFAKGTATSRDAQFAIQKATLAADDALSAQVRTRYENLVTQFREEVGIGADAQFLEKTTAVTKRALERALVNKEYRTDDVIREDGIWRAFVLSTLPDQVAEIALLGAITEDEELYTRFRESQAFQDYDEEFEEISGD